MIYSAHIYLLSGWTPSKKQVFVPYTEIFRKSIIYGTRICTVPSVDSINVEFIQFFSNLNQASRTVAIVWQYSNSPLEKTVAEEVLRPLVGSKMNTRSSSVIWINGELKECRGVVSQFLRESNALSESSFEAQDNLYFVADGRGIAVVDTTKNIERSDSQPGRSLRLSRVVSLAHAYMSVLDDVIESLGDAAQARNKNAEIELKKWSEFMSACYFAEPIKQTTIELGTFYKSVRDRQKVMQYAQEVTEQLRLLAELVRIERNEKQERNNVLNQRKLTIFGLLLTAVSLVQCTQVTPKVAKDFTKLWSPCVLSFSAACFPVDQTNELDSRLQGDASKKARVRREAKTINQK